MTRHRTICYLMIIILSLLLSTSSSANTYTVINTDDSGIGSLRWAILQANARLGPDTIEFSIASCGLLSVCTISPTSVLPPLTDDETFIDGYSQPATAMATESSPVAVLKIEIEGSSAGSVNGLRIQSADNVIRGLVINRFSGNGIYIFTADATSNHIAGNFIGTNYQGSSDLGNGLNGIFIGDGAKFNTIGYDDTVGGTDSNSERNIISGNDWNGIGIHGSSTTSNRVQSNYIGLAASGSTPLGNNLNGILLYGDTHLNYILESNLIGGNLQNGIAITGSTTHNNRITSNFIGTDESLTLDLGNSHSGILINLGSYDNELRYNKILMNDKHGVEIRDSGTNTNVLFSNRIGAFSGWEVNGNTLHGVYIHNGASNNQIGESHKGNTVIGNSWGVIVSGASSTGNNISSNSIFLNFFDGIDLGPGANGNISPPVITSVTKEPHHVIGTACTNCTVEVFMNGSGDEEGETYMGSTTADSNGDFNLALSALSHPYLTATATDTLKGTSKFSVQYYNYRPFPWQMLLPAITNMGSSR